MSVRKPDSAYYLRLGNYRGRIAELYSDVRRSTDSAGQTWSAWHGARNELLSTHSESAFAEEGVAPAPFWDYDENFRTVGVIDERPTNDLILAEGEDIVKRRFHGVGHIEFALGDATYALPIYWADSYGGGWFLPFRDATNGSETFGSGRYVLDGAKGVDLGTDSAGNLILDFNYSFHPSCVWGNWMCPLPSARASLDVAIPAGERRHEANEANA